MGNLHKFKEPESVAIESVKLSLQERIELLEHRIEYRRMVDFEDREAIYHLRRKAYAKNNSDIEEWAAGTVDNPHEENTDTIGLFIDGRLAGSVRVTLATEAFPNCQSRKYSTEAVDQLLKLGGVVLDPGRLVADPAATREFPELPYLLLKVTMSACQYFDAQSCLSLVNKKHSPFYSRVFHMKSIDGPIWCEPLQCELNLMCGDVERDISTVLERFPFWKASYLEMRQMFGPIKDWICVEQAPRH